MWSHGNVAFKVGRRVLFRRALSPSPRVTKVHEKFTYRMSSFKRRPPINASFEKGKLK